MKPTREELKTRLGNAETRYAESFTNSHNVVGLATQWQLIKELREQLKKEDGGAALNIPAPSLT